ncbi:MAG: riboflavin biosynthesis protein RibF [Opitutales bacterium]
MLNQTERQSLEEVDLKGKTLHLAIGMFDGVHLGHQAVIEAAIHSARREGGTVGVLTFWPHPSVFFQSEKPTPLIMTPEIKTRFLRKLGVDLVIEQKFDDRFSAIPAEEFLPHLKKHLPTLQAIYVGENWRFGRGRKGDVSLLAAEGKKVGIHVISVHRVQYDREPISSTRIRHAFFEGRIEEANSLLGHNYFSEGVVKEGKGLGRNLGFPTLNIPWTRDLRPRFGVYCVGVMPRDGAAGPLPGVANFGVRPTVTHEEQEPVLEIHLLTEECPFSAGDHLVVEWLSFIRSERKFDGVEALSEQIAKDCCEAKARLKHSLPK